MKEVEQVQPLNWLDEQVQEKLLKDSPAYRRQVYCRANDLDERLPLDFEAQAPWWLWR